MNTRENKCALEDKIKLAMYQEFHKKNKKLFKVDRMEYWEQCNRHINTYFHVRVAEAQKSRYASRETQTT